MATLPPWAQEKAIRAGFTPGPAMGDDMFQAIIDAPGGLIVGSVDPDEWDHFKVISTADGKVNLDVPEMLEWLGEIEPALEQALLKEDEDEYPLIMSSGLHMDGNANSQMRDPVWNEGKTYHWFRMHPDDAAKQDLVDGQMVRVIIGTDMFDYDSCIFMISFICFFEKDPGGNYETSILILNTA